ncbi:hypothetical protein Scep_025223 [Stephania cephalantha]|uniref:Uncharacterized protein n=1 Tax=Stephania cephalantha TaxID=152367 RepID=A0AAP0EIA9_9MAGN
MAPVLSSLLNTKDLPSSTFWHEPHGRGSTSSSTGMALQLLSSSNTVTVAASTFTNAIANTNRAVHMMIITIISPRAIDIDNYLYIDGGIDRARCDEKLK